MIKNVKNLLISASDFFHNVKDLIKEKIKKIFVKEKIDTSDITPRFFFNTSPFTVTIEPSIAHAELLKSHGHSLVETLKVDPFEAVFIPNMFISFFSPNRAVGEKNITGEFIFPTKKELDLAGLNIKSCDGLKECRQRHKKARAEFLMSQNNLKMANL